MIRPKLCLYINWYKYFHHVCFFLFWIYINIWCIHSTSKQWIRSFIEEKIVRYKQTLVMKNWRKSGPVRPDRFRLCSTIIVLFKYFKNSLNPISFRRRNYTLKSTYIIWSMNGSEQEQILQIVLSDKTIAEKDFSIQKD
jgi:hypothetical protein